MITGISNNSILSALFGPGVARGFRVSGDQPNPRLTGSSGEPESSEPISSMDTVEISEAGKTAANNPLSSGDDAKTNLSGQEELSPEEQQQVKELKKRDQEVRRHEQAHKAAAGQHATGGATFEYETGPDGKRYAVGGEVSISTSEIPNDPEATIQKMQQIRRAALAPGHPSGQDRSVAAQAQAAERAARSELAQQRREKMSEVGHSPSAEKSNPSQISKTGNTIDTGSTQDSYSYTSSGSLSDIGIASGGELLDVIA